jgi:transcriptional regulator GlxA family with amidase domain
MAVKFIFLLLPNTHILDLAGPDQVLFEAIGCGADFELEYCSYTRDLSTSAGLALGAVKHFQEVQCKPGDYLMIPGSDLSFLLENHELKAQTALFDWIRGLYARQINLCSICSGSFLLAHCGLLDGKKATTHWKRTRLLQELYPKVQVLDNVLFTEEKGIYTSAGIASGIDLALYLVQQLKGAFFAHTIAREMVVYNRRNGDQSQHSIYFKYRNHIHTGVHVAQDWLEANLEQKTNIESLAEKACMSARNFTRVFKKETGLTVVQYLTALRSERLKKLLRNPNLSRSQMAKACGLESERQLSRLIRSL